MNTKHLLCALPIALASMLPSAHAAEADDMISVTMTAKTPDAVVAAIKSYTEEKKWIYFGDGKIKNGEITLVKVCIPAVGKELFAAGLKTSALAPCGNLSVYVEHGKTQVALLNPMYMNVLYPNEHVKKAGALASPLLNTMVETIAK
jgi:hypothetical protein